MNPEVGPKPERSEREIGREYIDKLSNHLEPEDIEFLMKEIVAEEDAMSSDEVLGYTYGRLLELGYDPDSTLEELGIIEQE